MATLSAPGIGSGLDINGIVEQLMAVEQIPLQRLQAKAGEYLTQISAYGQLRSAMASFQDATAALESFNDFNAFATRSSDPEVFAVTAGNNATLGSYEIQVSSRAASQKLGSVAIADADTTVHGNAGDQLTIGIGENEFTVDTGGKTLSEIQTAINEATDNVGVMAGIIRENDSSFRLSLTSDETGLANAMTFAFADSDGAAVPDPLGFTEVRAAADAEITLDDAYTITRSSNSISDAIQGVTIELLSSSPDKHSLSISREPGAIVESVEKFVEGYNELLTSLGDLREGELSGDGTLRLVETQVRSVLGSGANLTGAYAYASDVGISFQKDGTLTFDSAKLDSALKDDLPAVADLFANDDQGLAFRLSAKLDGMLETSGLIDAREDGLNDRVDKNNQQMARMQDRMELVEARYRAQFSTLDTLLGELQVTSDYMTAQLSALENLQPGNQS